MISNRSQSEPEKASSCQSSSSKLRETPLHGDPTWKPHVVMRKPSRKWPSRERSTYDWTTSKTTIKVRAGSKVGPRMILSVHDEFDLGSSRSKRQQLRSKCNNWL